MPQKQHTIHGRDHLPTGADPIPGLAPSLGLAGNYPASILQYDVRGYWRLGEGTDPYEDTSDYHPLDVADLVVGTGSGTAMTEDVTPGLLPDDQDDGAVAFNQEGHASSSPQRIHLSGPVDLDARAHFNFGTANPAMTAIARIKPGTASATFWGSIIGVFKDESSSPTAWTSGWALQVLFPASQLTFLRHTAFGSQLSATSPVGSIDPDTEYTVAGTYDGTTIRVYIDGELVASQADATSLPTVTTSTPVTIAIGGWNYRTSGANNIWQPFYGVIDEAAVFGVTLTDAQIAGLHTEATSTVVEAGFVLASDGAGGTNWVAPTFEVNY